MADQRGTIKTYALAGKSATETHKLLKEAYGEKALGRSQTFQLHKEVREGRQDVQDQRGRHGQQRTVRTPENVAKVDSLISADRRLTIDEVAVECGLSHRTIHTILHKDLGLSKLSARWVPRLLTDDHKRQHLEMATHFKKEYLAKGKAFLESLVTMDESWVCYSTPELKSQSMQWLPKGSNPPKKAKVENSAKKIMLIAFFDFKGMIYQHYLPKGQTINSVYYMKVLTNFLVHLRKKRPEKLIDGWLLHQDNARPHVSKATMEFMTKKRINLLPHAPYSPDLAPCDFWLFPQLKKFLAGSKFDTETELKTAVEGYTREVSKNGLLFVMESWDKRLTKCIEFQGDYVEK